MIRLWWLLCCVIAVNKGGIMSELFCGENGRMESVILLSDDGMQYSGVCIEVVMWHLLWVNSFFCFSFSMNGFRS